MKVNAEDILNFVHPLFNLIASPSLTGAISQYKIFQIVSYFSGGLAVVLASHVDRVFLDLEALEDCIISKRFQI